MGRKPNYKTGQIAVVLYPELTEAFGKPDAAGLSFSRSEGVSKCEPSSKEHGCGVH